MEYNETVQVNAKKTIQEHIDSGTLSDFIDKMINVGYMFFEKSEIIGFNEFEKSSIELTLEEKECFSFIVAKSDSELMSDILLENQLTEFENYNILLRGLVNEYVYKFNNFPTDKMQTNFANILKRKVQFINTVLEYLLSCEQQVCFDYDIQTTFEKDREWFYHSLIWFMEGYKSVLVLLVESYHPEKYVTNEEQYIENTKNQFTWSKPATDLAELVYTLAKTERIKSTSTGKPATKEELLKYFSEQFGINITQQSLLSKSKNTFKRKDDSKTFTRQLADLFDDYRNSKV